MRLEDRDAGPDVSDADAIAGEVALHEQAVEAQQELARGDLRAVQRRLAAVFPGAVINHTARVLRHARD